MFCRLNTFPKLYTIARRENPIACSNSLRKKEFVHSERTLTVNPSAEQSPLRKQTRKTRKIDRYPSPALSQDYFTWFCPTKTNSFPNSSRSLIRLRASKLRCKRELKLTDGLRILLITRSWEQNSVPFESKFVRFYEFPENHLADAGSKMCSKMKAPMWTRPCGSVRTLPAAQV